MKLIDLVIELVDARIPYSSRNPDIDELAGNKFRIILLNKSDLADPVRTDEWVKYYEAKGFAVLEINARNGNGMRSIGGLVQKVCRERIERDRKRGIVPSKAWSWEFRMSENLPLSMPLWVEPVPGRAINRALPKGNSGFA